MPLDLTQVVQRADNFIHWISRYPALQMYSNQCFWQPPFHTIPFLNLTNASTLFTNYRTIRKILRTFYLPDSELSSTSGPMKIEVWKRYCTTDKIIPPLNNWGLVSLIHPRCSKLGYSKNVFRLLNQKS